LLEAHKSPYTLDDVARYDWPAAIELVRKKTGQRQVSVLAHCLSSPTFLLSMVRGYLSSDSIRAMVASQVALHLRFTPIGTAKVKLHLDRLLPSGDMVHQRPQVKDSNLADIAASLMSLILPTTFSCNNRACYRHVATFGELILHSRIDSETHAIMGDLVPECLTAFLKDVAVWGRKDSILTEKDLDHLDRLQLPIHFISGSENRMFVPESTEASWRFLSEANDESYYRRTVYQGFGHLDCYFGHGASEQIWPDIANTLAA
jgi:cholesterol oxidase